MSAAYKARDKHIAGKTLEQSISWRGLHVYEVLTYAAGQLWGVA